ncbi:hypothetical protein DFAR_160004 [Desulfarculales bacterium]
MTEAEIQNLAGERVTAELDRRLTTFGEARAMTMVASKGALDMADPVLILATTAEAMDLETTISFTILRPGHHQ